MGWMLVGTILNVGSEGESRVDAREGAVREHGDVLCAPPDVSLSGRWEPRSAESAPARPRGASRALR